MSLSGALNVGKTALAVHQAAIQVTSNNISNAGNENYTRQTPVLTAAGDRQIRQGIFVGTGVNLSDITRNIDEALEARLRGSISDTELANVRQQWLGRVEAVFNELGDDDLSTRLSTFFGSWSNLSNQPQDNGLRQVVLQDGKALAGTFQDMRSSLGELQSDIDNRLTALARDANGIADQIAELNQRISTAEGGSGGTANGLRDNRDALLKKLSELMDIRTVDVGNGVINVVSGSHPIILGTTNRGITFASETNPATGELEPILADATNGAKLEVKSGAFGALTSLRDEIGGVIDKVDSLAGNLIFELNKVHSEGQGTQGLNLATGSTVLANAAVPLNDPATQLPFQVANGSFELQIWSMQGSTVASKTTTLISVNPNTTTLNSLAATLDSVSGVSASVVGGKLRIQSENAQVRFAFGNDSSDALAALGINTFFSGSTARDIAVNSELAKQPSLLAASLNGETADNQNGRRIAQLETMAIAGLGGLSIKDSYESMINGIAVSASASKTSAESSAAVYETLMNQREALSGVSLDEEAINLMKEQRAFQGAARIISAVDELMQTLLSMV